MVLKYQLSLMLQDLTIYEAFTFSTTSKFWIWYSHCFALTFLPQPRVKLVFYYLFVFVYLFICFLGPHLWHMEAPRLGFKSELQLPAYTTATAHQIQVASETYTTAQSNVGSLTHWARPGIKPATSWFLVRFVTTAPQQELQPWVKLYIVWWLWRSYLSFFKTTQILGDLLRLFSSLFWIMISKRNRITFLISQTEFTIRSFLEQSQYQDVFVRHLEMVCLCFLVYRKHSTGWTLPLGKERMGTMTFMVHDSDAPCWVSILKSPTPIVEEVPWFYPVSAIWGELFCSFFYLAKGDKECDLWELHSFLFI